MGKIIIFFLLLGSIAFAQPSKSASTQAQADSTIKKLSELQQEQATASQSLSSIDSKLNNPTTLGNFALTVGTTATQVSAISVPIKWVRILNLTNGAIVYYGSSAVTTSSGSGAYGYKDGDRFYNEFDNLNDLWLISTQSNTDVRISYGN